MMGLNGNLVTQESGMFDLEEFALGLSRIARFGGQTVFNWSVAQHSLVVERLAVAAMSGQRGPRTGPPYGRPELPFYALIHDFHEVFTSDIPTTFKTPDVKKMQQALDVRIYSSLGIAPPHAEYIKIIRQLDRDALIAEARVVTPPATYTRIWYEVGYGAAEEDVEIVRDILIDTQDAALSLLQRTKQYLGVTA